MISKELLSEVLKKDVPINSKGFNIVDVKGNIIYYGIEFSFRKEINIYELAHKCKEWALSEGYIIEVGVHPTIKKDRSDRDYFYKITTDRGQILVSKFDEIIKTEPEAIFLACEWILKEMR